MLNMTVAATEKNKVMHSLKPWLVVFSGALFFFYDFIQLNMFNALSAPLIREFHISAMQLGELSAYYFYGMIPLLLPAGIILDRVSIRKIILTGMAAMTLGTLGFSLTHQFWIAEVCRLITGISGTFCLLSAVKLASRWFPPRRLALVIGLIVTMAMLGGVVAQTPLTLLTDALGWRSTLFLDGLLGVAFFILMLLFVQDYPPGYELEQQKQRGFLNTLGFWKSLQLAAANLQNWAGGIYTCMLNLPVFLLGGIWGAMYLSQAHHLSRTAASLGTSMLFVGTIIGSPVVGWFSDRIGLRRLPMLICALSALIIMLVIMYSPPLSLTMAMFWLFLLGFFISGQIISYPLIAESNSPALTGTAEGLAAVIIMAGGCTQTLFGWLMDLRWNHAVTDQISVYSVSNYRLAMAIFPVAFVIGLIAALLVKETYCRGRE